MGKYSNLYKNKKTKVIADGHEIEIRKLTTKENIQLAGMGQKAQQAANQLEAAETMTAISAHIIACGTDNEISVEEVEQMTMDAQTFITELTEAIVEHSGLNKETVEPSGEESGKK